MGKKWLTFDLDGTLMQNPFMDWVFPEIVTGIQEELTAERDVWKLILDEHLTRMREGRILEAYNWDEIIEGILVDLEVSVKIDVEEIVKKHCVAPKIHLLEDGILESLAQLVEMGYSLAAVTNGYYKYQIPVMEKLGLDSVFEEVVTPDKCGYAKPHIGMLEVLEGEGEIIAHVGDRIDHDIGMANKYGICSIFISRKLPESVKQLPINQRNTHKDFLQFYEQKWKKENNKPGHPLPNPTLTITTIQELVQGDRSLVPK